MRAGELTPLLSCALYSSQERVTCTSPGRESGAGHGDVHEGDQTQGPGAGKLVGPTVEQAVMGGPAEAVLEISPGW